MADKDQAQETAKKSGHWRWGLAAMLVAALAAGFALRYFESPSGGSKAGPLRFAMHVRPKEAANVAFVTGDSVPMTLNDFRGRVVLLNIWATWCPPCRQEMPSLDRLQAKLGGPDFEVVALSIDKDAKGLAEVKSFYAEVGLRHLRVFQDPTAGAGFVLGTVGVPTTLLIDRQGRELGRLTGTAEWDSDEALKFVRSTIAAEPSKQ